MIELVGKYTTAKIFAETIEEGVYSQVYDIINCRAFEGQKVVCMPDVHVGASGPCGLVAIIGDYVCPEHILCEEYDTIEDAQRRLHRLYWVNAIKNDQSKIITAAREDNFATIIYTDGCTSFYTIEQVQKETNT